MIIKADKLLPSAEHEIKSDNPSVILLYVTLVDTTVHAPKERRQEKSMWRQLFTVSIIDTHFYL